MVVSAEGIFLKERNADAQTLEIRDNDTVLRTQFLPIKPQCHLPENDEIKQRNSSYELRGGKLYRITRVKKKIALGPCEEAKAERRISQWGANKLKTFAQFSGVSGEVDPKNSTFEKTWQFWTSSQPITSKTIARKKEKIKKRTRCM